MVDLVFREPSSSIQPIDLVFGADEAASGIVGLRIEAGLPGLTAHILLDVEAATLALNATLPALTATILAEADNDIPNYLRARSGLPWQPAVPGPAAQPAAPWRSGSGSARVVGVRWRDATSSTRRVGLPWSATAPVLPRPVAARWQQGTYLEHRSRTPWREATALFPRPIAARWRQGAYLEHHVRAPWHSGMPTQHRWPFAWSQARPTLTMRRAPWGVGRSVTVSDRLPWGRGLLLISYGGPPLPVIPPVVPPGPERCYTPPVGNVSLVFSEGYPASLDLVFTCENHGPVGPPALVVVPIRKVYMVTNSVTLRVAVGGHVLPTFSLSLTLDVDSWTWGFSASVPGGELANVSPSGGAPVELEAIINGATYKLLAEKIVRDRTFNSSVLRISGRGKNAVLDAPYAVTKSFGSTTTRTSQQLMDDVLTEGGVGIGWDVQFGLDPWLVPAAAWSHQGTYVSALNAIAQAGGGYLQPHATANTWRVLARYPTAPWDWGSVSPDFELPSAVTTQEGIEWVDKPVYNRVFVSGQSVGVLGQVTRAGTAGDLVAPMVTDALITAAAAARQRGTVVLADTGRQARVSLRLPVLPATGVIEPGKFVRYVDGATTRLGIVRSVNVDVGLPEVWQTLGVETHV